MNNKDRVIDWAALALFYFVFLVINVYNAIECIGNQDSYLFVFANGCISCMCLTETIKYINKIWNEMKEEK